VLILGDLLDRRRGAWRVEGGELVFATNVDRQAFEGSLRRREEIVRSLATPAAR
jgi:hypothetical protein